MPASFPSDANVAAAVSFGPIDPAGRSSVAASRDINRTWRRNDATPFLAILGYGPARHAGAGFGFGLFINGSDELGRIAKRRIATVDHNLCQQRGDRTGMVERILKFLLNHVADHASGLGAQHIQWISLIRLVGV
tara:strand:+ start:464 stop:868 length:405 start_codon:yes stop_codon:yes gene_type:complete